MSDICIQSPLTPARLRSAEGLIKTLESLRQQALDQESGLMRDMAGNWPVERQASARNLAHYLALRQSDLRPLQEQLALLGLSRLARSEAHALASLDAVLAALYALTGRQPRRRKAGPVSIGSGSRLLATHARELLGEKPKGRDVHIMVTMPSEAASQPELLQDLLLAGMDVMRINCAHDGPDDWLAMIANLRAAQQATGRQCNIYADLAGPKLRTGTLRPLGRRMEFKPGRDDWGRVTSPAQVWITPQENPEPAPEGVATVLPVTGSVLIEARVGDSLALEDSRGSQRDVSLVERRGHSWLGQSQHHTYLRDGAACVLYRDVVQLARGVVGPLPEWVTPLLLRVGDFLQLTPEDEPGEPARYDDQGTLVEPASIPCTLEAVFSAVRPGQPIWFDDGRIGGVVRSVQARRVLVEITQAPPRGARLRPEKGINLPDTEFDIPALTDKDLADLAVLAPHVDTVGLSFVRHPGDVQDLHQRLADLGAGHIGTVLKIETRQGFENLPRILLTALAHPPVGIMVARGDLAVEIGFERLAEVQEEILWLCEAAHVPVIWATQVLESMAKRGQPSRAEVSDAAFGVRSECVMLNKGPYIVETTRFLSGVLGRMAGHHAKRRPVMRRLAVSDGLQGPDRSH